MAQNYADHEFGLYRQLAEALGESLEAVYNMLEKERGELITVLGLGRGNDNDDIGVETHASEEITEQVQFEEDIVKLFNDDSDNLVSDNDQFGYLSDGSAVFDKEVVVEATVEKGDDPNNNKSQNQNQNQEC